METYDSVLVLVPPALDVNQIETFSSRPLFIRIHGLLRIYLYFEGSTRYAYSLKSGWGIGTPNDGFQIILITTFNQMILILKQFNLSKC